MVSIYVKFRGVSYNQQMGVFSSFSPVAQILVNRKGGSSGSVSWSQRGIFQDGSSIETWIKTIGSWTAWDLVVQKTMGSVDKTSSRCTFPVNLR